MKQTRIMLSLFFCFALITSAGYSKDNISEADSLFAKGGFDNFKKSIELYQEALKENPNSYEINWKLSRSCTWVAEYSKRQELNGWKDICAKYGKMGMNYGDKAMQLEPNKVEGYTYFSICCGSYSDGVSILTALKEGLKGKTQSSIEKAYSINKYFDDSRIIVGQFRFWHVLPWPLHDYDKALKFANEYFSLPNAEVNSKTNHYLGDQVRILYSELLMDVGGKENKSKAKELLLKSVNSEEKYFAAWSKRLLKKLE